MLSTREKGQLPMILWLVLEIMWKYYKLYFEISLNLSRVSMNQNTLKTGMIKTMLFKMRENSNKFVNGTQMTILLK